MDGKLDGSLLEFSHIRSKVIIIIEQIILGRVLQEDADSVLTFLFILVSDFLSLFSIGKTERV